jgi:putative ABC transport system permease protein
MRVMFEALGHSLSFAVRRIWKSPGFSLVAISFLALGIGTTTTIFSVVNAVALRPIDFPEPERLVRVAELTPQGGLYSTSEPTLLDWRAMNRSFEELAGYDQPTLNLTGQGEPERVNALAASHSLLQVLGITPTLGRAILPEEDRPAAENRVVLLSQRFWERRFGSESDIIGRGLTLGGAPHIVVGVVPLPAFPFGDRDVIVPLAADPNAHRANHYITAVGRLAPGVSLEAARADMAAIARQIGEAYPSSNQGWSVALAPYDQWLVGHDAQRAVFALLGAVVFLLLLACANVANLQMARGLARRREIAVRSALGAGRTRIVWQLMTESAILAAIGAGVGVLLTAWTLPLVQAFGPADLPRLGEVSIDGRVLLFALSAAVVTSILFGLTPALHASGGDLHTALKEESRSVVATNRLRDALVIGQLALAVVLLVGAGLMARSFLRMQTVDLGYDTENVIAIRLQIPTDSALERQAFFRTVEQRLSDLPGVVGVGSTFLDPFEGGSTSNRVAAADWEPRSPEEFLPIEWRTITSGFFDAMRIPLLRGRALNDGDSTFTHTVISQSLADRLWPGEDPIGKRIIWRRVEGSRLEVVGVVGDVLDRRLSERPDPTLYLHHNWATWSTMTVIVRTAGDPSLLTDAIRREIRSIAPDIPIPAIQPLAQLASGATGGQLFLSRLFAIFAALGLTLAALGVYAVMMYQVSQRYREIGVRMALGARPEQIVHLVLRHSLLRALVGLTIGLAGAVILTRLITSLLFQTEPTDPLTYATVTLLLAATAIAVTVIPAIKATRVDPLQTLAAE